MSVQEPDVGQEINIQNLTVKKAMFCGKKTGLVEMENNV